MAGRYAIWRLASRHDGAEAAHSRGRSLMSWRLDALLLLLLLAASPAAAQAAPADAPVVASVNGAELQKSDVEAAQRTLPPQVQQLRLAESYPALISQLGSGMRLIE